MIWFVIALSVSAFAAVSYCLDTTIKALRQGRISHDRCHDHAQSMLQMSTVRAEAQALRRAATMFDSIEEQHSLKVLAREKYTGPDGPSVPALWLREQATKLDGKTHD